MAGLKLARGGSTRGERPFRGVRVNAARRLLRQPAALLGLLYLVAVSLGAVVAPWLAPHDPLVIFPGNSYRPPAWAAQSGTGEPGEAWRFPLGTDAIGRDLLSRVIFGARTSLLAGIAPTIAVMIVGGLIGLVAGAGAPGARADPRPSRTRVHHCGAGPWPPTTRCALAAPVAECDRYADCRGLDTYPYLYGRRGDPGLLWAGGTVGKRARSAVSDELGRVAVGGEGGDQRTAVATGSAGPCAGLSHPCLHSGQRWATRCP